MTLTRHARALAAARQEEAEIAQRACYRERLLRLQAAFEPPLTNAELSLALDLAAPKEGETGPSEVARFLSESPHWRRARPDGFTRALIDALLAGELLIAARRPVPGARREVLVGEARDLQVLGGGWQVRNLTGGAVPTLRGRAEPHDWERGELWDLFDVPPPALAAPSSPLAAAAGDLGPWLGRPWPRVGLGTMRLSTGIDAEGRDARPEREVALAMIVDALERGVALIDTADAYSWPGEPPGHNELLVREALERWAGDRAGVVVATKAGMVRQGSRYLPSGHPDHLRQACEASLQRLGVDALDLWQLHLPDPRVPLAESLGAFARLREQGKCRAVGLCNVTPGQLDEALAVVELAAVQVALSYFELEPLRNGLWRRCRELGLPLLAHSPLGGWRAAGRAERDVALLQQARRRGISPPQAALAWLGGVEGVVPLVGATRPASWTSSLAALDAALDAEALAALDAALEARKTKSPAPLDRRVWRTPSRTRSAAPQAGEVVLLVGPPAAGKTERVEPFVERGYYRLNRDLLGGRLDDLLPRLRAELRAGRRHFVLDNTYSTRASRRGVLEIAAAHGLPARALWLDVPVEEALYNACLRMIARRGRVLEPDELKKASRQDPNLLPPGAIYRFFELFEPPSPSEGFAAVERMAFVRRQPADRSGKALILDIDGTVRGTTTGAPFPRDPAEVVLLPGRREVLERWQGAGYRLAAVSNQAQIGLGQVPEAVAVACFDRTRELLGLDLEITYCPHPPSSAGVWTRKPMPGLGVELVERHGLRRELCHFVGDQEVDRLFAANCGFVFHPADAFFAGGGAVPPS